MSSRRNTQSSSSNEPTMDVQATLATLAQTVQLLTQLHQNQAPVAPKQRFQKHLELKTGGKPWFIFIEDQCPVLYDQRQKWIDDVVTTANSSEFGVWWVVNDATRRFAGSHQASIQSQYMKFTSLPMKISYLIVSLVFLRSEPSLIDNMCDL